MTSAHSLLWLALGLLILWVVLRLALAITGVLLHLLWICAIVFAIIWLFRLVTGRKAP